MVDLPVSDSIIVEPFFGKPRSDKLWPDVLVFMPFSDEFRPIYDHIRPIVESLGVTCKRADDFFTTKMVIEDVWSATYYSKLCIADCTGRNANVFYELGIAHTLGRPTILITQNQADVPFDIRHIRIIEYEYNSPAVTKLEDGLRLTVQSELGDLLDLVETKTALANAIQPFLESYPDRTQKQYLSRIRIFMDWMDEQPADSISNLIKRYLQELEKTSKPGTLGSARTILKGLVKTLATQDSGKYAGDVLAIDSIELPKR